MSKVILGKPLVSDRDKHSKERRIYPTEGRERLTTYRSKLTATIEWIVYRPGAAPERFDEVRECGLLPIMVRVRR